jgi:molybdopterin-binding protein
MNRLSGTITKIETSDRLSIVHVELIDGLSMQAILIETPDTSSALQKDIPATLLFKETEVHLATGSKPTQLSLQNAVPGEIVDQQKGKLLTRVSLETPAGPISAILPTTASADLGLKPGVRVTALVGFSEIMLEEV